MTKWIHLIHLMVPAAFSLAMLLATAGTAAAAEEDTRTPPYYVAMDPPIVYPGAIIRLQVRPPAGATGGTVFVAGRRYIGQMEDGLFVAYFAVDIDTLPGPYELRYDVGSRHGTRIVTVRARRMDEEGRGGRGLSKGDLKVEELVRSHPRLMSLWNRTTLERYWSGAFQVPSSGRMTATFAMRKTSEESQGLPHTGVDLAARGDVVVANVGVVALVAEGPGARIVAVDHGLGLYTYYYGLSQVVVSEGQRLKRGATIGRMGDSSEELHFGARLAGAQVDPVSLPGIALKVPELSGTRAPKEEKDKTSDYDY